MHVHELWGHGHLSDTGPQLPLTLLLGSHAYSWVECGPYEHVSAAHHITMEEVLMLSAIRITLAGSKEEYQKLASEYFKLSVGMSP